jgi:outer membrane lipoprotein SlyB
MTISTHLPSGERSADRSAWRIHAIQSVTSVVGVLTGAVMGAAAGAIVGVLAGPPGMWTGALLGGLAGTAAGRVMYVQGARTSKHDADLDEEIGVTSHNLGRPPVEALGPRL